MALPEIKPSPMHETTFHYNKINQKSLITNFKFFLNYLEKTFPANLSDLLV